MDQRVPPSRQNRIMDILIASRRTQINIQGKTHIWWISEALVSTVTDSKTFHMCTEGMCDLVEKDG